MVWRPRICIRCGRDLARQPVTGFGRPVVMFGSPGMLLPWAVERGLLVRSMWNYNEMPREVALALRDDMRAPFDPRPLVVSLRPVDPASVQREAAAAASETLAAITAVIEAMSAGPVPLKALNLARLAPTVLVSAKPQTETLTALRVAGYAPAGVHTDGSPAIEITPRRRAESGPSDSELEEMLPEPALIDPAELARNLLRDGTLRTARRW